MSFLATVMVIYFSCVMPFAPVALSRSISLYSLRYSSSPSCFMGIRMDSSKSDLFSLWLLMVIFVVAPLSKLFRSSEYVRNMLSLSSRLATR